MSDATERTRALDVVVGSLDDGLSHLTCCKDDDLSLCGVDVSKVPWGRQPGDIDCPMCAFADDRDDCPRGQKCDF